MLLNADGSTNIDALVQLLRETPGLLGHQVTRVLVSWCTTLDYDEARRVGDARLAKAREKGRTQPYGDPGDDKRVDIDRWSCLAEQSVAQWLNLPWRNEILDDLSVKPPDVGDDIEVRWTAHPHGHLIVHEEDHDDRSFVLVRGRKPMWIEGWILGSDAKKVAYRNNRQARSLLDYWVPASDLQPMADLR